MIVLTHNDMEDADACKRRMLKNREEDFCTYSLRVNRQKEDGYYFGTLNECRDQAGHLENDVYFVPSEIVQILLDKDLKTAEELGSFDLVERSC